MRWYLNDGHQTHGPMDEESLKAMLRRGFHGQVMSDPGGAWVPISRSPFAALESKTAAVTSWLTRLLVAGTVLFVLAFVGLVAYARLSR